MPGACCHGRRIMIHVQPLTTDSRVKEGVPDTGRYEGRARRGLGPGRAAAWRLPGRPGPSPGWWARGAGQDSLRSRALGSVLAVAPLSCPKIHLHTRGQDVALAVPKCRWLLAQQRGLSGGACRPRRAGGPGVASVGKLPCPRERELHAQQPGSPEAGGIRGHRGFLGDAPSAATADSQTLRGPCQPTYPEIRQRIKR